MPRHLNDHSMRSFSKTALAGAVGSALLAAANAAWAEDPWSCELELIQCRAGCELDLGVCQTKCYGKYPADSTPFWICVGECLSEFDSCGAGCTETFIDCLKS